MWWTQKALRKVVALALVGVLVYVLAVNFRQARENGRLVNELSQRDAKRDKEIIDSLAKIIQVVLDVERRAAETGQPSPVNLEGAIKVLRDAFPRDLVEQAVREASAANARGADGSDGERGPAGPPGAQGPAGPAGPAGEEATTTTTRLPSTTTTTSADCLLVVDLVVRAQLGC